MAARPRYAAAECDEFRAGGEDADQDAASPRRRPAAQPARWWPWRSLPESSPTHAIAFVDQVIVSGASFFSTVIIGRYALPRELGSFAMGMSVLISAVATLKALITWPYTIQQHQPLRSPAEHAGGVLAQSTLLAGFVALALVLAAGGLGVAAANRDLVDMALILAAVAPFALLREFARQFAFAHLQVGRTLILDAGVAALQVGGLTALAWTKSLSAASAYTVIGAACGVCGAMWLYTMRRRFVIRAGGVRRTICASWGLGKWLFANQIMLSVQGYAAYWILAWIDGASGAGVYTACMSIALFSNPFILAFSNVFSPKATLAWVEGGGRPLQGYTIRSAIAIAAAMIVFCLVVIVGGDALIHFLYPSKVYAGQGVTVALLSISMLAWAVGIPASSALTSMEHPRIVFTTGTAAAWLTVLLVGCLAAKWGLLGAAWASVAGNVVKSAAYWIAFLVLLPRTAPRRAAGTSGATPGRDEALAVIRQFLDARDIDDWVVEHFAAGHQANLYGVRPGGAIGAAAWGNYRSLVVKLYKSEFAQPARVRDEFRSLSRLHAALAARTIGGWKVSSPHPLHICERPLGIVMSVVPGETLNRLIEAENGCTAEAIASLPRVLVGALRKFWADGRQFGDLNLDNILCSPETREIAFVDPSIPPDYLICDNLPKSWYPASHDMARLIYETAVTVRQTIGKPNAQLRKKMFVAATLRAFADIAAAGSRKSALFAEIGVCAKGFAQLLDLSFSAKGAWHLVLRPIAAARIEEIIEIASRDGCRLAGSGLAAEPRAETADWKVQPPDRIEWQPWMG